MKINDDFEMRRDKYQWILTHWADGVGNKGDNKGKPIRVKRETYHPNIEQVCREVLDRELGKCETLADIPKYLEKAVSELTGYLERKVGGGKL